MQGKSVDCILPSSVIEVTIEDESMSLLEVNVQYSTIHLLIAIN